MIDEKILVEQLNELKDKCWDRAKKENNINFARKQMDISQVIGIINIQPKICVWIPCSERLPEESGFYMVTKKIKETGNRFTGKSHFDTQKGWNDPLNFVDIVAWQPLPEVYHE